MKRIVTVLTATALMVVLMAATAAPAFADRGYHQGTCERHCEIYSAGKSNDQVEKENKLWGWGSNQPQFPYETEY